jgi:hypothetical protein
MWPCRRRFVLLHTNMYVHPPLSIFLSTLNYLFPFHLDHNLIFLNSGILSQLNSSVSAEKDTSTKTNMDPLKMLRQVQRIEQLSISAIVSGDHLFSLTGSNQTLESSTGGMPPQWCAEIEGSFDASSITVRTPREEQTKSADSARKSRKKLRTLRLSGYLLRRES